MAGMAVSVTGSKEFVAKLAKMGSALGGKNLELACAAGGLLIANAAKRKAPARTASLRRSIHVGGHTSKTPDFGRGTGARSYSDIGGNLATETSAQVIVGTNLEYAAQVEYGGTIRPKNGKSLAIPVSATAKKYDPRNFPSKLTLVVTSDKVYLMGPTGTIHYILVKSVTQRARPYLRPAIDENRQAVVEEIRNALADLLRGPSR